MITYVIILLLFHSVVAVQGLIESNECLVASGGPQGFGSNIFQLTHMLSHFENRSAENKTFFWDFRNSVYTCCPSCLNNGWSEIFANSGTVLDPYIRSPPSSWMKSGGEIITLDDDNNNNEIKNETTTSTTIKKKLKCMQWNYLTVDIHIRNAYKVHPEETCNNMIRGLFHYNII